MRLDTLSRKVVTSPDKLKAVNHFLFHVSPVEGLVLN